MTEAITAAGDERLEALESSFLSWETAPAVHAALALLPPAELSPPGALDAQAMMATVHSTSRKCC
jgi:hypothetical protein